MDTAGIEAQLMAEAQEHVEVNHHVLGPWKSFLGGAVRIALCNSCQRHAIAEILPVGDDDAGNQVYHSDIRGSALKFECNGKATRC